ncbi:flavodoxin I [Bacillus mesophilus]|uniref:Flavodoxin n=1 Tax=Bacillus mesophilus TaxID=1808955 RepID=A0A6M0Q917_9BACI|nr:flavodoxin [Bacillus mesophilus]MBM7661854.1 flavodoxin I [Bacillus mesophilus]NEY72783.1 flavodoxin [Bacillus mesophilus]
MAKVVIAYASMSGNTEEIADLLKVSIEPFEHEIDVLEIEHMDVNDVLNYDGILIGSYTWGDGDLPYETEDFYEELLTLDLTGKKAAVFGSGDTVYPKFCEAVVLFENRLKECNAEIIQEGLKVEFTPDSQEEIDRCVDFAVNFASLIEV